MNVSEQGKNFRVYLNGRHHPEMQVDGPVSRSLMLSRAVDTVQFYQARLASGEESVVAELSDAGLFDVFPLSGRSVYQGPHAPVCQVSIFDPSTNREELIHYGRVVAANMIRDGDERVLFESRADWQMFGGSVRGSLVIKKLEGIKGFVLQRDYLQFWIALLSNLPGASGFFDRSPFTFVGGDLVFNPVVDGIQMPNRYGVEFTSQELRYIDVFVDTASIAREILSEELFPKLPGPLLPKVSWLIEDWKHRRALRRKYGVGFWKVDEVLWYLFQSLNPEEKHFKNPHRRSLAYACDRQFPKDNGQYISNVVIPAGSNLLDALAVVCSPRSIDFVVRHDSIRKRTIEIILPTKNYDKSLYAKAARRGTINDLTPVDLDTDRAYKWDMAIDLSQEYMSGVEIRADNPMVEVTVPLYPAWTPYYDNHPLHELSLDSLSWFEDDKLPRVWRDWVANENDEYTDLRETNSVPDINKAISQDSEFISRWFISSLLTYPVPIKWIDGVMWPLNAIRKRRRLLPMLTSREDTQPLGSTNGIEVEFSTKSGSGNDAEWSGWKPVSEMNDAPFAILNDEMGIRFTGLVPPAELYSVPIENLRMRATASIECDSPLRIYIRAIGSVLGDHKIKVVDVGNKYSLGWRSEHVEVGSQYHTTSIPYRGRADYQHLHVVARDLISQWSWPQFRGTIAVDSLSDRDANPDRADMLGRTISKIPGRQIDLRVKNNRSPVSASVLPIVSSIKYSEDSQEALLNLGIYYPR